jgi:hypothetical protein
MIITKEVFMQGTAERCVHCGKFFSGKEDLGSIYETGMCLGCDHVWGECLEERLLEMKRDTEQKGGALTRD